MLCEHVYHPAKRAHAFAQVCQMFSSSRLQTNCPQWGNVLQDICSSISFFDVVIACTWVFLSSNQGSITDAEPRSNRILTWITHVWTDPEIICSRWQMVLTSCDVQSAKFKSLIHIFSLTFKCFFPFSFARLIFCAVFAEPKNIDLSFDAQDGKEIGHYS